MAAPISLQQALHACTMFSRPLQSGNHFLKGSRFEVRRLGVMNSGRCCSSHRTQVSVHSFEFFFALESPSLLYLLIFIVLQGALAKNVHQRKDICFECKCVFVLFLCVMG